MVVGLVAVMAAAGCGTNDTGGTIGPAGEPATTIGTNVPAGSTLLVADLAAPGGAVTGKARVRLDPALSQVCTDLTVTGPVGTGPSELVTSSGQVAVALLPPAAGTSSTCRIVVRQLFTALGPGGVVQVGQLKGTLK